MVETEEGGRAAAAREKTISESHTGLLSGFGGWKMERGCKGGRGRGDGVCTTCLDRLVDSVCACLCVCLIGCASCFQDACVYVASSLQ